MVDGIRHIVIDVAVILAVSLMPSTIATTVLRLEVLNWNLNC